MHCNCPDTTHDRIGTTLWHRAWCHWFDRREAGNRVRAALWGWIADRIVRFA